MKALILTAATLVALAATVTASAGPTRTAATLTIRHEAIGCHSWSLNGGPYAAGQSVRLLQGQTLVVVNRDSSLHRLVQESGGAVDIDSGPWQRVRVPSGAAVPLPPDPGDPIAEAGDGVMAHWGATTVVTFYEPGVHVLTTLEGDVFPGWENASSGPDHTLTVRVLVVPRLHYPPL